MADVLFDFDGTLFDTYEGVSRCVNFALKALGKNMLEDSVLRRFLGPPIPMSFREYAGLGGEDVEKATALFRAEYAERGLYESRPYDGIKELLARLKARGVRTAIASSKPQFAIETLLKRNGMEELFDKVVGVDGVRQSPDKSDILLAAASEKNAVMVGDRLYDMAAAKSCGFKSIGVTYGFGSEEELKEAGADMVAANCKELESAIYMLTKQGDKS